MFFPLRPFCIFASLQVLLSSSSFSFPALNKFLTTGSKMVTILSEVTAPSKLLLPTENPFSAPGTRPKNKERIENSLSKGTYVYNEEQERYVLLSDLNATELDMNLSSLEVNSPKGNELIQMATKGDNLQEPPPSFNVTKGFNFNAAYANKNSLSRY